jgi:hypothetical protein
MITDRTTVDGDKFIVGEIEHHLFHSSEGFALRFLVARVFRQSYDVRTDNCK